MAKTLVSGCCWCSFSQQIAGFLVQIFPTKPVHCRISGSDFLDKTSPLQDFWCSFPTKPVQTRTVTPTSAATSNAGWALSLSLRWLAAHCQVLRWGTPWVEAMEISWGVHHETWREFIMKQRDLIDHDKEFGISLCNVSGFIRMKHGHFSPWRIGTYEVPVVNNMDFRMEHGDVSKRHGDWIVTRLGISNAVNPEPSTKMVVSCGFLEWGYPQIIKLKKKPSIETIHWFSNRNHPSWGYAPWRAGTPPWLWTFGDGGKPRALGYPWATGYF